MAVGRDVQALLWDRPAGRRGPKPSLTHERIAAAGVALADAEGLGAATMQRLAEALDVTKMALYRYVPGKAELLALMTEAALGDPPVPAGRSWRAALREWTRELLDRFCRHPWTLTTTVGARPIGPNEVAWLEVVCARLAGCGLTGAEVLDVAVTLVGHARSLAQQAAAVRTDSVENTVHRGMAAVLRGREDRYPALAAALASAAESGGDRGFDFGLDRILDGVEQLIRERAQ